MKLSEITFRNQKCLELSNGTVKLIISIGFGPRVLFYGYENGQNFFKIFEEELDNGISEEVWKSYGGHRLWHAPEVPGRTYFVDSAPVKYEWDGKQLTLLCAPERENSLCKTIDVFLSAQGTLVKLNHKITNIGNWDIELSAWALSVMAPGSRLIVPQEPYQCHGAEPGGTFEAARPLVLWPFTRMNDPRFTWGGEFIQMRESGEFPSKLKFGVLNQCGWEACVLGEEVFVKRHESFEDALYPDYGCNAEFFTMPGFLEIESLSPLILIPPGETLEHFESWELHKLAVGTTDQEIASAMSRIL